MIRHCPSRPFSSAFCTVKSSPDLVDERAKLKTSDDLQRDFRAIDGKGYKSYKQIAGSYAFEGFVLRFDHVQGDPFADPSRLTILVPPTSAELPEEALGSTTRRVGTADFLNRLLAQELEKHATGVGSGRSGALTVLRPGQEVLRRSSVFVTEDGSVEARIRAGLPARGRSVLGAEAVELICNALPRAVEGALFSRSFAIKELVAHVETVEDTRALRDALSDLRLVAFVADDSVLPRRSGVDDRPLQSAQVVPFRAPDSLRITIETPNGGPVSGMGVPEGVTLLVGGGFHGKSTLLRAIQRGVYDHIPGDGREKVVARADSVKVRAEDGRAIHGTDISNFIGNLPGGNDTSCFRTANASGSTSQAAAIAEALELGSGCLLIDEDTSATNFLIRDARVQALISREDEPITAFIDRLGHLRKSRVSLILVVGGSGDYFDLADTVIAMRAYEPREVTGEARAIVESVPTRRVAEKRGWNEITPRSPAPEQIQPARGNRDVLVKAYSAHRLAFGTAELDLSALEQLVESAQTRAIARTLVWARGNCINGRRTILEALRCTMEQLKEGGLDLIDERRMGEYAEFRIFELAGVLNRLRTSSPE